MSSSANGGGERHWEVWSNATRNLLGYFSTEIKALTALSDAQRKSGSAYIRSLTLAAVDGSHVDAMTDQRLLRHLKKPRD